MKILVTGSAGFIGFHLTQRLLERGDEVVGYDNINNYYDTGLKYSRLAETGIERSDIVKGKLVRSSKYPAYRFVQEELENRTFINELFAAEKFDAVVNLAAQAGVRYSLTNPHAYIDANITGFLNILEASRHNAIKHLVYASSSSVYGSHTKMPFSVHDGVDHPISLYAASKKANELMAHTYSHLFNVPTTGLRFFTVYGPWGRPDMALFIFTKAILEGEPIEIFNQGEMQRDFTYVDDIVEGVIRVIDNPAVPDPSWNSSAPDPAGSNAPYRVYNIGNSSPVKLLDYVDALESALNMKAEKKLLPMQPGDVPATWADVGALKRDLNYQPNTSVRDGVARFVKWYLDYFKRNSADKA